VTFPEAPRGEDVDPIVLPIGHGDPAFGFPRVAAHAKPSYFNTAELLAWARRRFNQADVDAPAVTALVLLEHACGVSREFALAHPEQPIPETPAGHFRAFVERRCAREPLAYLLGFREFYGRRFSVGPSTLIPRPETEDLVELALKILDRAPHQGRLPSILEVGTGSGVIAVTLLLERTALHAVATDVDVRALHVARENARAHHVEDRLHLLASHLGECLERTTEPTSGFFRLVVANLPYIPSGQIDDLAPEIAHYEPRRALDGGPSGTSLISETIRTIPRLIGAEGAAIFEIGEGQARPLLDEARAVLPRAQVSIVEDAAGAKRFLVVDQG